MKKLLLALALAAIAAPASATLQIAADISGTVFLCADNQACDLNPAIGQLQIADQTINGVRIVGSSQVQSTLGGLGFLNTSSFQIENLVTAARTIILAISGVDFIGPATTADMSGSGTFQNATGSTINLSFYGDPANQQGADTPLDLPGIQLGSFVDVAANLADAFSYSNTSPFPANGPFYSMSLGTSGTLVAWNGVVGQNPTLVGRSQTILAPLAVPEPGTLFLLGAGLLGIGVMRRRS